MNVKPTTIEASESTAVFPALLERVNAGEEITITKHEKPVARLVPFDQPSRVELQKLFAQMAAFRADHPVNPQGQEKIGYRDLIDGSRGR